MPSKSASSQDADANRGGVLLESVWVMAGIATLAVVGRFSSRKMSGQDWKVDDWMTVVGLVLAIGCCICSTVSVELGIGKHLEPMKDSFPYVSFWKTLYAYNQIYVMTGPANKIATLLMYRRIFEIPMFYKIVKYAIALCVMWWLAMSISGIFTCIPVQAYWLQDIPGKKCMSLLEYDIGYAVVNIVLDFFILFLPIREIWRLQLTKPQKVALSIVFLVGIFACVTAIVRLLVAIIYVDDPDFTWVYLDALVWTAIEPLVAVICICLPTLRPILRFVLPHRFSLSSGRKSGPPSAEQKKIVTIGSLKQKQNNQTDPMEYTQYSEYTQYTQLGDDESTKGGAYEMELRGEQKGDDTEGGNRDGGKDKKRGYVLTRKDPGDHS